MIEIINPPCVQCLTTENIEDYGGEPWCTNCIYIQENDEIEGEGEEELLVFSDEEGEGDRELLVFSDEEGEE